MNTTTNANGQRKTLASQIDRLDSMLDGLADGLNDAVAQAVQSAVALAVKEAVQAVLTEILTNPAVRAKLRAAAQAAEPEQAAAQAAQPEQPADEPAPKKPGRFASWRDWVGAKLKKVGEGCKAGCQRVRDAGITLARRAVSTIRTVATSVRQKATRVAATGWLLGRFLFQMAAAFGSGLAIRIAVFITGFILASSSSDLWAVMLATIARTIAWLRHLLAALAWWAASRPTFQEI